MIDDLTLGTTADTQLFQAMFKAYYRYYERAYDSDEIFNIRVHDHYTVWVNHYKKILEVYNEEIDVLNGYIEKETVEGTSTDKRDETRNKTGTNDSTTSIDNTANSTVTNTGTNAVANTGSDVVKKYDYPNFSGAGYETSQDNTEYGKTSTETRNTTDTENRTLDSTTTFDGDTTENSTYVADNETSRSTERNLTRVNAIEQRELYYKTVHNIMLEFILKFSPCFLKIYY